MNFQFKGAICNNHAMQDTNGFLMPGSTPLGNTRVSDTTAFVGDLDLSAVWQIGPHWITRIGYQAIWVQNLAQAARNFDQPALVLENGPAPIDVTGKAVYHGPHIGLEFDW